MRRPTTAVGPLLAGLFMAASTLRAAIMPDAPITDFRLPMFDAVTGKKTADLSGATALFRSPIVIEFKDFTLSLYRADGGAQLEIQSPNATVFTQESVAVGSDTIRVRAPDYEITGRDWRWNARDNEVAIRQNVRVTFNARLMSLLK